MVVEVVFERVVVVSRVMVGSIAEVQIHLCRIGHAEDCGDKMACEIVEFCRSWQWLCSGCIDRLPAIVMI